MRRPIKYQFFKLTITAAGNFPINAETDKSYRKVTGIHFSTTDPASLKDSVFTKLDIDSAEIYSEGFEVKMIRTGDEVPFDDRFAKLDERAEGSPIVVNYKDGGNAAAYPYNAYIYLRLENPIDNDNAKA